MLIEMLSGFTANISMETQKPSIRDQLRTAAKQQPEKKSPVKSKAHDMEL